MLLWREAPSEVTMYKTQHVRTTFGSSDVEKVHAVVVRSTFRSQNAKNYMFVPFLDVEVSFRVAAQGILHPAKSEQNVQVL